MELTRVWHNRRGLVAAGLLTLGSGIAFGAVYVLTVRTTPGREFGDATLRGALLTQAGVARAVDGVLGIVSVATLLTGLATVVLIALIRLRRVPGLAAAGLLVAANATTRLLKTQLLSRPDLGLSEITPATHNSLPSGHTTAVFSVVVALLVVVPAGLRRPLAVIGGACAVLTALATMSAGWHRAGDSIAAFLTVGFWAGVASLVMVLAAGTASPTEVSPLLEGRWRARVGRVVLVSATLGLGLVLALGLVEPLRASAVGALVAFLAGGLLVLATAVSVLVAHLMVLDRSTFGP